MKKNLKLYVWEDVLSDYTDGIMFALAESKEEAMAIIISKAENEIYPKKRDDLLRMIKEDLENEPKVYADKVGFFVFGGA